MPVPRVIWARSAKPLVEAISNACLATSETGWPDVREGSKVTFVATNVISPPASIRRSYGDSEAVSGLVVVI